MWENHVQNKKTIVFKYFFSTRQNMQGLTKWQLAEEGTLSLVGRDHFMGVLRFENSHCYFYTTYNLISKQYTTIYMYICIYLLKYHSVQNVSADSFNVLHPLHFCESTRRDLSSSKAASG